MLISRRDFAKGMGAASLLLPFLRPALATAAGATTIPRLLIVYSLGTTYTDWQPQSAPGQPIVFNQANTPLKAVADDIVLVDGLSFDNPVEGHSTPQTLSGSGFSSNNHVSVDQYIAGKLGGKSPLLLGVEAASEGQFFNTTANSANSGRIPPIDNPTDAFNEVFGGAPPPAASGATLPRQNILDLVTSQIKQLQGTLGSQQKAKLDEHLTSIANLQQQASGATAGASCTKPAAPNLGGASFESDPATIMVGEAQQDILVAALACGTVNIAGMQWGISNRAYLAGSVNQDEHSMVHSGSVGQASVIAAEQYLSTWFANLVTKLKATPDPKASGKSLLDNTFVIWTRDIGDGPTHTQYSMPYVLAGATGYLKKATGGLYVSLGGNNASSTVGPPHQRLLLNLCEAMGVDYSAFGELAAGSTKTPLTEIKA